MLKSCLMLFISLSCFLFALVFCGRTLCNDALSLRFICEFYVYQRAVPRGHGRQLFAEMAQRFFTAGDVRNRCFAFSFAHTIDENRSAPFGIKTGGVQYTTQYARIALCFNADGQRRIYAFLCPGRHVEFTPYLCLESDSTQRILPVP